MVIYWDAPPSNSHHPDYYIFFVGDLYQPLFPTVTGRGFASQVIYIYISTCLGGLGAASSFAPKRPSFCWSKVKHEVEREAQKAVKRLQVGGSPDVEKNSNKTGLTCNNRLPGKFQSSKMG